MKKKIKNIMAITLSILLILTTISFAEEGFSVPQEETLSIISLPENTVKGQFSVEAKGNTINQSSQKANVTTSVVSDDNGSAIGILLNGTWQLGTNYSVTRQIHNINNGDKVYVYCKIKNSSISDLREFARLRYSDDSQDAVGSFNGGFNEVSLILTATKTDKANLLFAEGASGQIDRDYQVLINMTANGIEDWTEEQMLDLVRQGYWDNAKSTNSVRLTSVNKNLFDKKASRISGYLSEDGNSYASTDWFAFDFIRVKSDTAYRLSNFSPSSVAYVNFYDIHKNLISGISNTTANSVFSTPNNCAYIRFSTKSKTFDSAQLEEGTLPTDYVEHEKSEVYVDIPFNNGELTSVPNGTADSVDLNSGKATQRNKKYVLQSGDITLVTTLTNVQRVWINKPLDYIGRGNRDDYAGFHFDGFETDSFYTNNEDNADYEYHSSARLANDLIGLIVPLGTYVDTAEAQSDLAGTELIYQLAEEQTYELPTTPLIAYPNGTIIIEPAVSDVGVYNSGIAISNTALPIVSNTLEVKKIETSGVRTLVDTSEITVSADGKTFTINGASDGQTYEFTYQYPEELTTIPTITYSVPIDQTGQINGNTNMINQHNDLIDLILQEIQALKEEITTVE